MNTIKEAKEYGLLAEFVYLKLENENFGEEYGTFRDKENIRLFIQGKKKPKPSSTSTEVETQPITVDELEEMTDIKPHRQEAMLGVLDKYDIKEFSSDDGYFSSDFQGMLLQNKETGQFVIAFRGTAGEKDIIVDVAIAGNHNYQYNEAIEFTKHCMEKYNIKKEDLVLTGHSLGGILVQMVGSELKIPGYAFNPLGSQNLVHPLFPKAYRFLEEFGLYESAESKFAKENIINISYNDVGAINGDALSNFATNIIGSKHMGQVVNIFGKNLGLDAHNMSITNELLEKLEQENISSIEELIEYNKKVIEHEQQNSHEQRLKDWQSMTPEQRATAINNGYGLGLSYNTQGIQDLKELSSELVIKFEEDKETKLSNIEVAMTKIDSQEDINSKLLILHDFDMASNLDNIYSKQLITQYQNKVIENRGQEVSTLDFIKMDIYSTDNSSFALNNHSNNSQTENQYVSVSQNNDSTQRDSSSIQMMS